MTKLLLLLSLPLFLISAKLNAYDRYCAIACQEHGGGGWRQGYTKLTVEKCRCADGQLISVKK